MARARNIKPGFFLNDTLAGCEPLARLLFAGLWTIADREGRLEDRPKRIKAEILPYDDCDPESLLQQLHDARFIVRYEADGERYIQVATWTKHQDPHYKERPSIIPAPPEHQDSGTTAGGVPEETRQAIFERDQRKCVECGAANDLSLDHIVARSKGGTHDEINLRTLCRRCNSAKNNRVARASLGQAHAKRDRSSADDRPTVDPPSGELAALIPDSLIPDSGFSESKDKDTVPTRQRAQRIIEYLNEKAGTRFHPGRVNLQFVMARLQEGASEEDCRQVIEAKCRQWRGTRMAQYLRPETLFNATKFASYVGASNEPERQEPLPTNARDAGRLAAARSILGDERQIFGDTDNVLALPCAAAR